MPKAEVTVAFVTVALLLGEKAEVAEVRESMQVLRVRSLFRLFRKFEQLVEIEVGIRRFCVEFPLADDMEDWAKATDVNAEINVKTPNIFKTQKD